MVAGASRRLAGVWYSIAPYCTVLYCTILVGAVGMVVDKPVYVGPHFGTVPVPALGPQFNNQVSFLNPILVPVPERDVPILAPQAVCFGTSCILCLCDV